MRFSDRAVIVTGGGSGIGRATAERFASEGAEVLVADLVPEKANQVAGEIVEGGGKAMPATADVTSAAQVDSMVGTAEEGFGRVDVLVNNAYACDADDILAMDEEAWNHDLAGSLTSAFLCSKRVLPGMLERRSGVIVSVSSVNALAALGNEAYSAGKAGLINLMQSIAVRYGADGIRANAVVPGTVRTPVWDTALEKVPDIFERLVKWYPLGRVGKPDDIASAVLFLSSDEASWITGTVLRVDGGLLAGNSVMTDELVDWMEG